MSEGPLWEGTEQLVQALGLSSDPRDRDALVAELRQRVAALHPDSLGGAFPDAAAEELYHRHLAALEYVRGSGTSLVRLEDARALIDQVATAVQQAARGPIETRVATARERARQTVTAGYTLPKISLGAVTAALGYVALSPSVLMDHPFLGPLFSGSSGVLIWAVLVIALVQLWLVTFLSERRTQRRAEALFSLEYHRHVLRSFGEAEKTEFSRTELADRFRSEVSRAPAPDPLSVLFGERVSQTIVEEATELAISRYLERNWVTVSQTHNDMDDWYRIVAAIG